MHDYRRLRVWQDAIELAVDGYGLVRAFPAEKKFNLISQMNRAAVSVGSNMGKGAGRATNGKFIQFLGFASGSCSELLTPAVIAERLGFGLSKLRDTVIQRNVHSKNDFHFHQNTTVAGILGEAIHPTTNYQYQLPQHERHYPRRRLRHSLAPTHAGRQQTAHAGL
jgi:four helix bundle protein